MKGIITLLGVGLLAIGAAACGDDGGALTIEEYFTEVQAIADDVNGQFEALFAEGSDAELLFDETAEVPARIDAARAFVDGNADIFGDALDQVRALDPPAEVADIHAEFLEALDDFPPLIDQASDLASDAESEADLGELFVLFESGEFEAADQRLTQACIAIEDAADANGITLNLECEDEG